MCSAAGISGGAEDAVSQAHTLPLGGCRFSLRLFLCLIYSYLSIIFKMFDLPEMKQNSRPLTRLTLSCWRLTSDQRPPACRQTRPGCPSHTGGPLFSSLLLSFSFPFFSFFSPSFPLFPPSPPSLLSFSVAKCVTPRGRFCVLPAVPSSTCKASHHPDRSSVSNTRWVGVTGPFCSILSCSPSAPHASAVWVPLRPHAWLHPARAFVAPAQAAELELSPRGVGRRLRTVPATGTSGPTASATPHVHEPTP